uniref:Uncharacterized protein n=1 Tax=Manihot esculenta TaxID=3983 RepID=A0A2C9UTY7_MANES
MCFKLQMPELFFQNGRCLGKNNCKGVWKILFPQKG